MFLKSETQSPPGGFRFYEARSNHWMSHIIKHGLLVKVAQHRHNMKFTPVSEGFPSLIAEIEEQICQRLSPANQLTHCKTGVRQRKSVPWQEVKSFIKTYAKWFGGGRELVPQEQAEARASICSTCPLNVGMSGCSSCREEVNDFTKDLLKRGTSKDELLQGCGVCGCELKSAVHLPLEALEAGSGKLQYPSWCFRVKEKAAVEPIDLSV